MDRYTRHLLFALLTLMAASCARKNFYAETPVADLQVYQQLQQQPEQVDSVTVRAGAHYKRGFLHRLFWGQHHRPIWSAPVTVPVFEMDTTWGGLEIEKKGGGFQTTSFTMVAPDNFTYALRSLDKEPSEVLPKVWRKTFVVNILRDQISAINPYAALVLPPMAQAAGIPTPNPKLVYVHPNDTDFGEYTDVASNRLYMLEEKYNDERTTDSIAGNPHDIVGSEKMLRHIYEEDDHFIDQQAFAKARLFDILVHDWDRHKGQWEWAEFKRDGNHYYKPIPKDRDNVFYRFQDGLIPWIFSRNWAIRKFESFDEEINDVYALTINSKYIDSRALSEVTRAQFDSLAQELQRQITDEVIEEAVSRYPDSAYELIGPNTKQKLISRRNQLREVASEFYEILAKEVTVVGSDEEDIFEVKRLNDEETEVTVRRESDGFVTYRRVFKRSETELITLHGLDEDDVFKISGEVRRGIKVKIYGGIGEDEIEDASKVGGWGKKTWVYDTVRGTELEPGPETKDKRTRDVRVHAFDREGYK